MVRRMPKSISEVSKTHFPTKLFLEWLQRECDRNGGTLPGFNKTIAAKVMGFDSGQQSRNGMFRGQIQSRIDFACYVNNLPPIGLASTEPFERGWQGNDWVVPTKDMGRAARARKWSKADFSNLQGTLAKLSLHGGTLWEKEGESSSAKIKRWAYSFASPGESRELAKVKSRWTRDELILTLHFYLHNRQAMPTKNSALLGELSRLINQMSPDRGSTHYRDAADVYMKLMNFQEIDLIYTADDRRPLSQERKDDQEVWDMFAARIAYLDGVVASLSAIIEVGRLDVAVDGSDEPEIEDCEEGRLLTRMHRYRERNRKLVADFKALSLKKHGRLHCGGCDGDFAIKYGAMSDRLIDVHHTKPIHTMMPGDRTDPSDLVLLCVSCHRAVHSEKQWLSVNELRRRLGKTLS